MNGTVLRVPDFSCALKISNAVGSKRVHFKAAGKVSLEHSKFSGCPSKNVFLHAALPSNVLFVYSRFKVFFVRSTGGNMFPYTINVIIEKNTACMLYVINKV